MIYLVKASTVPVRTLYMDELRSNIIRVMGGNGVKLKGDLLLVPRPGGGEKQEDQDMRPQRAWAVISSADEIHAVWRLFLDRVRRVLKEYARSALGESYEEELERLAAEAAGGSCEAREKLSAYLAGVADIVAYMLRYPLYRSPFTVPEAPVKAPGPHEALLVARLRGSIGAVQGVRGRRLAPERGVYNALDALYRGEERGLEELLYEKIARIAGDPETGLLLETIFYSVPADTRPGLNATSLLVHLLSVSAAATSSIHSELEGRRANGCDKGCIDVEVVRLASLLHDAGKPLDPRRHVDASVETAEKLLRGVVPASVLGAVKELVKAHHSRRGVEGAMCQGLCCLDASRLLHAIKAADQVMAGLDRLSWLVAALVKGEAEDPVGAREELTKIGAWIGERAGLPPEEALLTLYKGSRDRRVVEAYWRLLSSREGAELVREASEKLAKLMAGMWSRGLGAPSPGVERKPLRAGLAVIDIGGIQAGLSESYRLRSLAGFSMLVDFLTLAAVPYALTLYGAPLEAVVYAGGGTVHAIVPLRGSVDAAEEAIRRSIYKVIGSSAQYALALHGVKIRVGVAEVRSGVYGEIVAEAYRRLSEAPQAYGSGGVAGWLAGLFSGVAVACSSCGLRPAAVRFRDGEEYCLVCASRYQVSDVLGYGTEPGGTPKGLRMRVLQGMLDSIASGAYERFVERYSGGGFRVMKAVAGLAGRLGRNYAVLKSDGNTMGAFMASSVTATMYFERSIRIDMATKKAVQKILGRVYERARSRGEQSRWTHLLAATILGLMYTGGDDALLLVPAKAALPAALVLAYEFAADLGFMASLSVGVAAAPYKHNVWWAIQAATALLDDVAKEEARRHSIEALRNAGTVEPIGYIAFDYTDGWGLTAPRTKRRHRELRGSGVSVQPYPVARPPRGSRPGLYDMLSQLILQRPRDTAGAPRTADEDKQLLDSMLLLLDKFIEGEAEAFMKKLHAKLSRLTARAAPGMVALSSYAKKRLLLAIASAYATEKDARLKEMLWSIGRYAADLSSGDNIVIPLVDVYLIYKYARGD